MKMPKDWVPDPQDRWTVRYVDKGLINAFRIRALKEDRMLGDVMNDAIRTYLAVKGVESINGSSGDFA